MPKINWSDENFHPVVNLPTNYAVLDLSLGSWEPSKTDFYVGKYNEFRPNLYNTPIFSGIRNIHVGIDIGGPIGTACMAFMNGVISHFGYNSKPGDYGFVVITKHVISGNSVWALYGHLDSNSVKNKSIGQKVSAGDVIAWCGDYHENGGWDEEVLRVSGKPRMELLAKPESRGDKSRQVKNGEYRTSVFPMYSD